MGRALRVADALEAGMIWLNSENVRHLPTPFGGMKSSGIGRDGGDYSFDFYMETKHVSLAKGTHRIQRLGYLHPEERPPGRVSKDSHDLMVRDGAEEAPPHHEAERSGN
jgi:hypothetical protein